LRSTRRLSPDGLDWRDEAMPVYRNYTMRDGRKVEYADPDYEHRYREHLVEAAEQPNWRDDPTYNMRRRER
jgi:hypothetical protein